MSELLVKDKDVVAPGEVLATGMDYIPGKGAYRLGDNIYASETGLVQIDGRAVKLVQLAGKYLPKLDDMIICKVVDITMSGWRVDTNSAYSGMIGLKDGSSDFIQRGANLTKYFNIDEYVAAKVVNVTSQMLVDLSLIGPGLRKLRGGQIIQIGCKKVPRVIGKQGSMVSLIKDATGCQIVVGQNGRVWVNGDPMAQVIAVETIHKIANEAHTSGLTDSIKAFLEERTKGLNLNPGFKENSEHRDSENRDSENRDVRAGDNNEL